MGRQKEMKTLRGVLRRMSPAILLGGPQGASGGGGGIIQAMLSPVGASDICILVAEQLVLDLVVLAVSFPAASPRLRWHFGAPGHGG